MEDPNLYSSRSFDELKKQAKGQLEEFRKEANNFSTYLKEFNNLKVSEMKRLEDLKDSLEAEKRDWDA
jgi:hypothetical protein